MPRTKLEKHVEREPEKRTVREPKPERVPVGGFRDKLTVRFKNPEDEKRFYHRWVLDTHENGGRIYQFMNAGYEFVKSSEVIVGQESVFDSEDVGSLVRRPAGGDGKYLYLMRLPIEFREEDEAAKAAVVDATERSVLDPESLSEDKEGVYGKITISHHS